MTADGAPASKPIRVNGTLRPWAGGTLADLLSASGLDPLTQGIAIALNGEVVTRAAWARRAVEPGDVVEVVGAVQGG